MRLRSLCLLAAACGAPRLDGPEKLSQTGLYADRPGGAIAPGLFAFEPAWQLWSDGAEKARWLSLPPGGKIDTSDLGRWRFPVGTRLWKEFRKGELRLETRYLEKRAEGDGGWFQMAYVWTDDGSDAIAAPGGRRDVRGTGHDVPSTEDCVLCHDMVLTPVLGVDAIQLARGPDGPLQRLAAADLLGPPPAAEPVVPGDGAVRDALGYLHGNCGFCHNDDSAFRAGTRRMLLRLRPTDARPEDTDAYLTTIDVEMQHVMPVGIHLGVVPGDPEASQLYARMKTRERWWQMPPLATEVPDEAALRTIAEWIRGLR